MLRCPIASSFLLFSSRAVPRRRSAPPNPLPPHHKCSLPFSCSPRYFQQLSLPSVLEQITLYARPFPPQAFPNALVLHAVPYNHLPVRDTVQLQRLLHLHVFHLSFIHCVLPLAHVPDSLLVSSVP